MKRPSFQFYPADWLGNKNLRRCSAAARGAWIDVLCLLHDGDEYGVLRWPLADIAATAGHAMKLLRELVDKAVLKGGDKLKDDYQHRPVHAGKEGEPQTLVKADGGPCWYSSRMVRDEWARERRGGGTRFTPETQPNKSPKHTPKHTPKLPPMSAPQPPPNAKPTAPVGDESGYGASSASSSKTQVLPNVGDHSTSKPVDKSVKPIGDRSPKVNGKNVHDAQWWRDEKSMLAEGKKYKIAPHPGEQWADFRGRINAAKESERRSTTAPH